MATSTSIDDFKPVRLHKASRELSVVTKKIVAFLEENGYEDAYTGTNITDRITSEEAYLALKEEFASDAEAAERLRKLRETQSVEDDQKSESERHRVEPATSEEIWGELKRRHPPGSIREFEAKGGRGRRAFVDLGLGERTGFFRPKGASTRKNRATVEIESIDPKRERANVKLASDGKASKSPVPSQGESVVGVVTDLEENGASVEVGQLQGFIHLDDLAPDDVDHPEAVLDEGQRIRAEVLNVNERDGKEHLSLGFERSSSVLRQESIAAGSENMSQRSNPEKTRQMATEDSTKESPETTREIEETESSVPKRGEKVVGVVNGLHEKYGAFVEVGNLRGRIYRRDLSWKPFDHPKEILEEGEEVEGKVLRVKEENGEKLLDIGRKQLLPSPWESGDVVDGTVDSREHWGAFVELDEGGTGLLHISEMSWTEEIHDSKLKFREGDRVSVRIIDVDPEKGQIGLSEKRLNDEDLEREEVDPANLPAVGTAHTAKVLNTEDFGNELLVGLGAGIDGRMKLEDYAWGRVADDPSEMGVERGEDIEVVVLDINESSFRLRFGRKQRKENPWPSFAETFSEGAVHEAEVRRVKNGHLVAQLLPQGPETKIRWKDLEKGVSVDEDGDPERRDLSEHYRTGDELEIRIERFDPKKQNVSVSERPVQGSSSPSSNSEQPKENGSEEEDGEAGRNDAGESEVDVDQLKKEVRAEIREELREELKDEVAGDIREQLRREIRSELTEEARQAAESEVENWREVATENVDKKKDELRGWLEEEHDKLRTRRERHVENLRGLLTSREGEEESQLDTPSDKIDGDEVDVVEHVRQYVEGKGLYYEEGVIANFYTCLKSDYLVILSGISGVGKSKLPEHFAEALGGVFEMVPVRPNWNDDRDLLGYFNPRTQAYQSTNFLDTLIEADENRDRLFIICLDEMNLAPPEYYFALFLSRMESDAKDFRPDESFSEQVVERQISRMLVESERLNAKLDAADESMRDAIEHEMKMLDDRSDQLEKYRKVDIPPNVKFVGTVNVDHTTKGFSNKVLDRANVMQFGTPKLEEASKLDRDEIAPQLLSFERFQEFSEHESPMEDEDHEDYVKYLYDINGHLEKGGLAFGHRVVGAIERYMSLAIEGGYFEEMDDFSLDDAFDHQIIQRVLPKIQGMKTDGLEKALADLEKYLDDEGFERSKELVSDMSDQLENQGYVNYWEVR